MKDSRPSATKHRRHSEDVLEGGSSNAVSTSNSSSGINGGGGNSNGSNKKERPLSNGSDRTAKGKAPSRTKSASPDRSRRDPSSSSSPPSSRRSGESGASKPPTVTPPRPSHTGAVAAAARSPKKQASGVGEERVADEMRSRGNKGRGSRERHVASKEGRPAMAGEGGSGNGGSAAADRPPVARTKPAGHGVPEKRAVQGNAASETPKSGRNTVRSGASPAVGATTEELEELAGERLAGQAESAAFDDGDFGDDSDASEGAGGSADDGGLESDDEEGVAVEPELTSNDDEDVKAPTPPLPTPAASAAPPALPVGRAELHQERKVKTAHGSTSASASAPAVVPTPSSAVTPAPSPAPTPATVVVAAAPASSRQWQWETPVQQGSHAAAAAAGEAGAAGAAAAASGPSVAGGTLSQPKRSGKKRPRPIKTGIPVAAASAVQMPTAPGGTSFSKTVTPVAPSLAPNGKRSPGAGKGGTKDKNRARLEKKNRAAGTGVGVASRPQSQQTSGLSPVPQARRTQRAAAVVAAGKIKSTSEGGGGMAGGGAGGAGDDMMLGGGSGEGGAGGTVTGYEAGGPALDDSEEEATLDGLNEPPSAVVAPWASASEPKDMGPQEWFSAKTKVAEMIALDKDKTYTYPPNLSIGKGSPYKQYLAVVGKAYWLQQIQKQIGEKKLACK